MNPEEHEIENPAKGESIEERDARRRAGLLSRMGQDSSFDLTMEDLRKLRGRDKPIDYLEDDDDEAI